MPAKINLHGVLKEIDAVHSQLRAEKKASAPADAKTLDRIIKKLTAVRGATTKLCPKGQGVWPAAKKSK
jgi:hypothetical protein